MVPASPAVHLSPANGLSIFVAAKIPGHSGVAHSRFRQHWHKRLQRTPGQIRPTWLLERFAIDTTQTVSITKPLLIVQQTANIKAFSLRPTCSVPGQTRRQLLPAAAS